MVTTSAPDNLAQHVVARSATGVICNPSASAIAVTVRLLLEDSGDRSAHASEKDEAWLAEHSWDAVADQVAQVLRI